MQTISIPYRCSNEAKSFIAEVRRIYSAAVRTAYANAEGKSEKELRRLVKSRFAGGAVDAWTLHCATLEGRDKFKLVPDGSMIFGGKKNFVRRVAGLIGNDEWRTQRLLPLCTRGDKAVLGNRHFRLALDARSCIFMMYGQKFELQLSKMTGNAGEILRQAAALAADKQINITFRLDEQKLHVTIDPQDLPDHPERRKPVQAWKGRALGIDLNPEWIGLSAVDNMTNPEVLEETGLLEYALVQCPKRRDVTTETIREVLAATCDRAISLARKHHCGVMVLEKGLGKLRSGGKNRVLNGMINYWTRTILVHMLSRKARLAGIKVIEIWGGYSTTIGNLAFAAPDACASAAEIGRRGIAREAGVKEVLPAMASEGLFRRWKDGKDPTEGLVDLRRSPSWGDLHRKLKRAKLGVRRPHPESHLEPGGLAVHVLKLKHRPSWIYRSRPFAASTYGMKIPGLESLAVTPSTSNVG